MPTCENLITDKAERDLYKKMSCPFTMDGWEFKHANIINVSKKGTPSGVAILKEVAERSLPLYQTLKNSKRLRAAELTRHAFKLTLNDYLISFITRLWRKKVFS